MHTFHKQVKILRDRITLEVCLCLVCVKENSLLSYIPPCCVKMWSTSSKISNNPSVSIHCISTAQKSQ